MMIVVRQYTVDGQGGVIGVIVSVITLLGRGTVYVIGIVQIQLPHVMGICVLVRGLNQSHVTKSAVLLFTGGGWIGVIGVSVSVSKTEI